MPAEGLSTITVGGISQRGWEQETTPTPAAGQVAFADRNEATAYAEADEFGPKSK